MIDSSSGPPAAAASPGVEVPPRPAAPPPEISVLGPLDVRRCGRPVAVPGAKPRAALTLLGLYAGRVVPAATLVAVLWGDDPPRTARKALQTHISILRGVLGPGVLLTAGAGWRLATGTDVARFEAATRAGRDRAGAGDPVGAAQWFGAALDAWRGPPELPDAARGSSEIVRWIELREEVAEERFDALLAAGRAAELVGELELAVVEAPLRERRWAQLCLALYRSARQAEALAAYRRARTLLATRLAVEPGRELRRLHAAMLAQDPALSVPATAMGGAPAPLVATVPSRVPASPACRVTPTGRPAELDALRASLSRTERGESRSVVVCGGLGTGKSRLLAEALRAYAGSWLVAAGHCPPGAGGPAYAPLPAILRAVAADPVGGAVLGEAERDGAGPRTLLLGAPTRPAAGLARSCGGPAADPTTGIGQLRFFDAFARLLGELGQRRPTAVLFEDLHWADPQTVALVSFLTRNPAPRSVAVLVTVRTDGLNRDHPLRPVLAELTRAPRVDRIDLAALPDLGPVLTGPAEHHRDSPDGRTPSRIPAGPGDGPRRRAGAGWHVGARRRDDRVAR